MTGADRYLDGFVTFVADVATSRTLLDFAPKNLQQQWLAQQPQGVESLDRSGLEERIEAPWDPQQPIKPQVLECIGPLTNISLINSVCSQRGNPNAAKAILYFAPLWIRQPRNFHGATLRELVDHLFVRYPVPQALYTAWAAMNQEYRPDYKWLQWFICYGQGGSLHKLARVAEGWQVSKRFQHAFAQQDKQTSTIRAVISTELTLLKLSSRTEEFICAQAQYRIDLTAQWSRFDAEFLNHWRDTVRWLDLNTAELDHGTVGYLLAWSYRVIRMDRNFSWVGRSVEASLRHADELFQRNGWTFARWKRLDMDWEGSDGWTITELSYATDLIREGVVLNHCVGGYGHLCGTGYSAIFSLRRHGKPVITIELDPNTYAVKQALGHGNRASSIAERALIRQWLAHQRGASNY